ncbi:Vms1/Ankzf1 family peptidyl-tRNA hydrolase [Vulgatibacter sp.]|uniref:baeRF10 domain-containing protein n=1 Tax=Vulgatibacter sp. TaxID=1971226 RepID=UPI003563568A
MTPIDTALHELAGIRSDRDPVVTLYLNTRWADEHQRERVRLFVRERIRWARAEAGNGTNDDALNRTLDRVEAHVEELVRQARDTDANGVAVFACDGLGLFRSMTFGQTFREQFTVSESPALLQLARLADEWQSVIVAMVDGGGARIFESALGEVIGEATVQHTAPSRHKMGGWSQLHWQRHVRRQIDRNQTEAVEFVAFLWDEDPKSKVILVGPDRVVASFEKLLPDRVRASILCKLPNPRERNGDGRVRDKVMDAVLDELIALEERMESKDVETVVGDALAGGLAVLGPQDVVLAANEGRVHRLLIEDGFDQSGWRCRNCDAIGMNAMASCGYCGQETTTVNLGEELARRVLESEGEVEVLEPTARLHHYHGIAAQLRHRGTLSVQQGIGYAIEQPVF